GISPDTKKSGSGFFSVAFLVALLWWSRRSFTMAVQERGNRLSLVSLIFSGASTFFRENRALTFSARATRTLRSITLSPRCPLRPTKSRSATIRHHSLRSSRPYGLVTLLSNRPTVISRGTLRVSLSHGWV